MATQCEQYQCRGAQAYYKVHHTHNSKGFQVHSESRSCIGDPPVTTNYLTFTSSTQHTYLPTSVHVEYESSFAGWFRPRDFHEGVVKL